VAAGVERQRLQDIRPRLAKLDVEVAQRLRPRQRNLGRERARAHPAALLQLQQIAAVAQDRALGESFQDPFFLGQSLSLLHCSQVYAVGSSSPYSHCALMKWPFAKRSGSSSPLSPLLQ